LGSFIVKAYNPPQFMLALTTKTTVLLLLIGLAIAAGAIIFPTSARLFIFPSKQAYFPKC
jgi:hypothetical protein